MKLKNVMKKFGGDVPIIIYVNGEFIKATMSPPYEFEDYEILKVERTEYNTIKLYLKE